MKSTEQMMTDLQTPNREQLEANIKISHNWITALRSGTFSGGVALHIATLLDFLEKQNSEAVKTYESTFQKVPDWSKPADKVTA